MCNCLCDAAREAGARARAEPTDLSFKAGTNDKPDGAIHFAGESIIFDISNRCPASVSKAATASKHQGYCIAQTEAAKVKKYQPMAEATQATFVPCVTETTGAMGQPFISLMKKIIAYAEVNQPLYTVEEMSDRLSFRLAVALQKRNAKATLECIKLSRAPTFAEQQRIYQERQAVREASLAY